VTDDFLDWEGFGSDPVLQAFGGALSVEGIQSTGVVATIKRRMTMH
jgi:beta-glucosidase